MWDAHCETTTSVGTSDYYGLNRQVTGVTIVKPVHPLNEHNVKRGLKQSPLRIVQIWYTKGEYREAD